MRGGGARSLHDATAGGVVVLDIVPADLAACETIHPVVGVLLHVTSDRLDGAAPAETDADTWARLFRCQTFLDYAVINADDPRAVALAPRVSAKVLAFGLREPDGDGAFLRAGHLWYRFEGTECAVVPIADAPWRGDDGLDHALAAIAATLHFGVPRETLADALRSFVSTAPDAR